MKKIFIAKAVGICYNVFVMEGKTRFYVSNKNVMTWLMALCLVGSAVTRIVFACLKGSGDTAEVWAQIVLPVAATLLYVLIVLLGGKELFYKTAIPMFLMAVYYAIRPHMLLGSSALVQGLFIVCLLFFCLAYTVITCGKIRSVWLLVPLYLAAGALLVYLQRNLMGRGIEDHWMYVLPDYLFFGGLLLQSFAIRVHTDGEYHPTWGDRIDGRRVRTLPPIAQITSYIQVERNTCSNLFEEAIEITNIDRYIRQKRREGLKDFGITHVLLAAYVRGIAKYPQLNRFISGQKVYSRGNDIQYCMVVKKEMTVDSPDTSIKVHLTPYDTAEDVYNKLNAAIESVKKTTELDSSFDNLVALFTLIPGVVLKFTVWLLKLLDYFGLLPKFLMELSPFHGSLFFTSMGSLGIRPIYHHLYDFGNIPAFGAFGCKRRALEVQEDGTILQKKYVDIKFVLDERIVDGYYYATFFKHYRRLLAHPEVLDLPPEEVNKDID